MSELPSKQANRLVPDLSDQIQVGGQRLAKVKRQRRVEPEPESPTGASPVEEPAESAGRSFEEIAKKHLGKDPVRLLEQNADLLSALADAEEKKEQGTSDDDALPPVAEIASRIELYAEGEDAVPPLEPDPKKRGGITVSPIVGTDELPPDFLIGKAAPKTLWDLFSAFPQIDGVNWRIHVERKTPKLFGGIPCAGMLQPITRPITQAEWADYYGGGTYTLVVYGPPTRSARTLDALGKVQPKRMTEDISLTFPGPPSLDSMVYVEEEDPSMTQGMPGLGMRRVGPATIGDARTEEIKTNAELTREDRQQRERERQEQDKERLRKEAESAKGDVASQIASLTKQMLQQQADFRREMAEREDRYRADERRMQDRFEEKIEAMKQQRPERDPLELFMALKKIDGGDDSKAIDQLRRQHQQEIERLNDRYKEDNERAQRAIADERVRADRMIEEEKRRIELRIKDIEERAREAEREYRARADREVQLAKEDAERRINDLHRQHESRLADERANHDRDLRAKEAMHTLSIESIKGSYEQRLDGTRAEVKRTEADLERARKEAESNKDFVGKLAEFKEQAEAIGMTEGGHETEPPTVPQMLMGLVTNIIQNAPAVVEQIAGMARGKSEQEIVVARERMRQQMIAESQQFAPPPAALPDPGAAGGGRVRRSAVRPMHQASTIPLIPGQRLPYAPRPSESEGLRPAQDNLPDPAVDFSQAAPIVPIQHGAPPPGTGMPPEPQLSPNSPLAPANQGGSMIPPPFPSQAPPPMIESPAQNDAALRLEDQQILQSLPQVQALYEQGMAADGVANLIVTQFGPAAAAQAVKSMGSSDRIIEAIDRSGDPGSPFLLRDGKKFLRKLFELLGAK